MVLAGIEAPENAKKKTRSNACLAASDISGGSEREIRGEIRQKRWRIGSGMRRGASGEPKTGFLAGFSVVSPFYQGQIALPTAK
ncbi:hypothetical protein [Paraburkholderia caribensis]|uniref:hypothetical protein n=1 Tax=Paraburkholderia caribensis TaxID=75105 RepID=UPI0012E92CB7|nr:hypothetical protein [Paraburkholderia caribensis]